MWRWVSHEIVVKTPARDAAAAMWWLIRALGSSSGWLTYILSSWVFFFWQGISVFPWWTTCMSSWPGGWLSLEWTIHDREGQEPQCLLWPSHIPPYSNILLVVQVSPVYCSRVSLGVSRDHQESFWRLARTGGLLSFGLYFDFHKINMNFTLM